jgi:hypothetical protein
MDPIIVVTPALKPPSRQRSGESRLDPGRFTASVDGRVVVESSRQPFLDAARALIAEGQHPDTVIVMRHDGTVTDALRARLDAAARLTVDESTTRFARWKPHPLQNAEISSAGASIRGLNGTDGTQQLPDAETPEIGLAGRAPGRAQRGFRKRERGRTQRSAASQWP